MTVRLEDFHVLRTHTGEKVRIAQNDGLGDELRIEWVDRDGTPSETVKYDELAERAQNHDWERVAYAATGHVWGTSNGPVRCPECNQYRSADRTVGWEHKPASGRYAGGFVPQFECDNIGCDGRLGYEELKARGVWVDLDEME